MSSSRTIHRSDIDGVAWGRSLNRLALAVRVMLLIGLAFAPLAAPTAPAAPEIAAPAP
ncbi:MAG: hypothetical protein AAFW46_00265 [Pseudomonadota bacterium]